MEKKRMIQIVRSVKGTLMAHPDNEENSEFADRISSLEELEEELSMSGDSPRFSDVDIAKVACSEMGIDWNEEEDIYDAVRIKIWCQGAQWMQKALLNDADKNV